MRTRCGWRNGRRLPAILIRGTVVLLDFVWSLKNAVCRWLALPQVSTQDFNRIAKEATGWLECVRRSFG